MKIVSYQSLLGFYQLIILNFIFGGYDFILINGNRYNLRFLEKI
jgi:hypothetical protein